MTTGAFEATFGKESKTDTSSLGIPTPANQNADKLDVGQEKKTFAELLRHLHRGGGWGHWAIGKNGPATWWPVNEWLPAPTGPVEVYYSVNPLREIPPKSKSGRTDQQYIRSQRAYLSGINCVYAEIDAIDCVVVPQDTIEAMADQTEGAYKTRQDALDAAKTDLRASMFINDVEGYKALALERVTSWEPAPSAVIDSGGGYQAYWLLRHTFKFNEDGNLTKAGRLQRAWVESVATGADTGAKNLNRILRVAGTFNHKPEYGDPPPMVHFVHEMTDLGRVYSLKELETRVLEVKPDAFERHKPATSDNNANLAEKIVTAAGCLSRLSASRARSYAGRVEVGMILHNELGDAGFQLWLDWLQRNSEHEHEQEKCAQKWASFSTDDVEDKLGLGTLVMRANEDTPTAKPTGRTIDVITGEFEDAVQEPEPEPKPMPKSEAEQKPESIPTNGKLDLKALLETGGMPALPQKAQLSQGLGDDASPWLNEYIAFSRKWSPRAYDGFHEACAVWLLSTIAARRVVLHMSKSFYTPLYIKLAARTSLYAKSTTGDVSTDTIHKAGLDWLLAPDDATPQKFIKNLTIHLPPNYDDLKPEQQALHRKKLSLAGQRGWFYEEFGQHIESITKSGGYMAEFHNRKFPHSVFCDS